MLLALDTKYDIEMYDYFNQSEEFKKELHNDLYSFIEEAIVKNPKNLSIYHAIISDEVFASEINEEYEKAEILLQLKKRIEEEWGVIRLFT
jgi:hypothetical protein